MRSSLILLLLLAACSDATAPSDTLPGRYELQPQSAYTAGFIDLADDGSYTEKLTATVSFVRVTASYSGTYSIEPDSVALQPSRATDPQRVGHVKGRLQRRLAGLLLTYEKR